MTDSSLEEDSRCPSNRIFCQPSSTDGAEIVTEQLDGAIQQMEELEPENRMLKEQIARQGGGGAGEQQHGRKVTYQSYNQEMMAELSRLRPFEQEVQQLQKDLEEAKSFHKDAVLHHSRVITLTTKLSEMEEENRRVRVEYHDLEGSHKVLENEINCLRAQLQAKEAQVGQVVSHRPVQRAGGGAAESVEEVSQLKRRLDLKEREILKLKSQLAELASSMKPNPRARLKDGAMGQSTDEHPPLELPTDMVELQQLLREKDAHIAIISRQLQMFEKTAADLTKIVEHTKMQSRIVKDLRQELARKEGELKKKDNLTAAKDSVQDELESLQKSCTGKETALIATQHENDRLKKEIEQLRGRNAQLDFQLRQLQQRSIAASSQEQKAAHATAQLDEAVKERNHLEQKTIAQQAKIENTIQELAQSRRDVTQLTTEVEQLRKEKADLLGEVEAQTFQEDFQQERKDCEKAHSQVAEIKQRYQHQLQSLLEQLNCTTQELEHTKKDLNETRKCFDRHKDTLSTTETLLHSQLEKLSDRLIERDQEVAAVGKVEAHKVMTKIRRFKAASSQEQKAAHATAQLDEAVKERNHLEQQSKIENTQELAQSRRDVTQLTNDVEHLCKEKADLLGKVEEHKVMVETFAKETEEWRSAWNGERCRREGLERRITELEKVNDQLQQDNSVWNAERCRREGLERRITELEKVNDQLRQDNSYEFWNIPRSEVYLNMQKFLGSGAWGFVVEGTFRGQRVAVKCLHDMIRSPKFAEVMRKEIAIMAQVRHPNLVLLIAAVMDAKNSPLIITELLETSLRKAYEEKLLQGSSKLNIFRDIAAALNYLHLHHSGEIIHRDVSSANVLMEAKPDNQWKAKLSDFGSAKLAIEAKSTAPGAPVYSAPEVRKEMRIPQTAKLDVYSYGILLCEVTVEQFPDEESLPNMMQEVQGKWTFMHRLINSCIQNRPDRRPAMSYILSELNKL